jgi:hypothetical protein
MGCDCSKLDPSCVFDDDVSSILGISMDMDLVGKAGCPTKGTIYLDRLTEDNFKEKIYFKCNNFEQAVSNYTCKICETQTSPSNPIYTHAKYKNFDICYDCIVYVFTHANMHEFIHLPVYDLYELEHIVIMERRDEPCYSLKKIAEFIFHSKIEIIQLDRVT